MRAFNAARARYEQNVFARRARAAEEFARAVDVLSDAVDQMISVGVGLDELADLSVIDRRTLERLRAIPEA